MADLIQNVSEVYKKWEAKSASNFKNTGQRRDYQPSSSSYNNSRRSFSSSGQYTSCYDIKFRRRNKDTHFTLPKYAGLAQFKMAPSVLPENKPRPFVGTCCSKCLPFSRAGVTDARVFSLSICNVLHIPHFHCVEFKSYFDTWRHIRKPIYPDVSETVRVSNRVFKAIEKAYGDIENRKDLSFDISSTFYSKLSNQVQILINALSTSISVFCLQISSLLLRFCLSRTCDSILVHKGQIEILKSINQNGTPIIYLSVHRNALDRFLISFILFMSSIRVPLVATDSDFYIPLIGFFIKFVGAFYVKNCLENNERQNEDVYWTVLQTYFTECLKAGHSLEFSLEGGRSRSGKAHMNDPGFLLVIMDSVLKGHVEDVFLSTVTISYEKVIDRDFIPEQLGQPKDQETFFSFFCTIWRIMHSNLGNIRFNFSQPFSIKEFFQTVNKNLCGPLPITVTPPSSPSTFECIGEEAIQYKTSDLKCAVEKMLQHISYDTTCCTAVMSTHLIAFLFVTQHRRGATQQQLQNSVDWLREELLKKRQDTGFSGETLPVIKRAVELLGKHLVSTETIDMEWTSSDLENNNFKVTIYKPVTKLPDVLELQFYASSVVPAFLLDSIIVNALYALVDVEICHFRHCDSKLFVLRDKLVDKAIELNTILQFEFTSIPPCSDIHIVFNEIVDGLIEKECLHVVGVPITTTNVRYSNKAHPLSFEASDGDDSGSDDSIKLKDQQLKVDLTEESIGHLEFLRNIISPYIESYWLAAATLLKLVDEIKEESFFIQEMQNTAQEKLNKGLLAYEESFSADTFKNALKLFGHWKIIESCVQDGFKVVYLNDSYNSKEKLNHVISNIQDFRK